MGGYMDKALRVKDPRFVRALERLGYARKDMAQEGNAQADDAQAEDARADESISELREEYLAVVGRRPFHGWDSDLLRAKIAEAQA